MKRLFAGLFLLSIIMTTLAQEMTVTVSNEGNTQRQEVVEVDLQTILDSLSIMADDPLIVKNAFGQEVTYQKTYSGKLLLHVSVQPSSSVVYTITKGEPLPMKPYAQGKMYPERADDITWENDCGIYRVYGPALQRSGERSFGTDVWVKNTPELVVDDRYRQHMWGVGQRDSLKRIGKPKEANDIYMATSFHHDHGEGLVYVATLFPNGVDETIVLKGEQDHALGIVRQYIGLPYTYWFGSAWSGYDVRTQAQWQLCIDEFMNNLSNPLKLQF
ncbi:MAG: DUF4861 family protein [Prevotella sp.]|nr:DUF4861 family protein [Prevotella sp.]